MFAIIMTAELQQAIDHTYEVFGDVPKPRVIEGCPWSGESKIFDVRPYLDIGVFQELKDYHYFSMATVCDGTISWPHGQDFCPDTLYEKSSAEQLHASNCGNAKRVPL